MPRASVAALLALAGEVMRAAGRGQLGRRLERLVAAATLALAEIAAGVGDEAVQPGREAGLAAKLVDPRDHLCQRLLCRILRVLRIVEQVRGQPPHTRRVPFHQRLQGEAVAVLGTHGQHDIRQRGMRRLVAHPVSQR